MRLKLFSTLAVLGLLLSSAHDADAAKRRPRWAEKDKEVEQKQAPNGCKKKCKPKKCEEPCDGREECIGCGPGMGMCDEKIPPAFNAPARIDTVCSWDVFGSASFIYWHAAQHGMSLALTRDSESPSNRKEIFQDFEYNPGFKVAFGGSLRNHDDDWVGMIEYTRLHFSTSRKATRPEGDDSQMRASDLFINEFSLEGIDVLVASDLERLNSKWRCNLDIVDLELLRPYYQGRMLVVKPNASLRFGWLNQKINGSYETTQINLIFDQSPAFHSNVKHRSRSWFVGPRAGVDVKWELGKGFRIANSLNAALLYQRFKVRSKIFEYEDATVLDSTIRAKQSHVTPNFDIGTGLGWGSYLGDSRVHLDFLAAYEFNYFWNQNAIRETVDAHATTVYTGSTAHKRGDLFYHGLTLTARLDF